MLRYAIYAMLYYPILIIYTIPYYGTVYFDLYLYYISYVHADMHTYIVTYTCMHACVQDSGRVMS